VTVRRAHHGDLHAHSLQSSDPIRPTTPDGGAPLEFEAEFGEEIDGRIDVFHHDADVIQPLDRHLAALASAAPGDPRFTGWMDQTLRRSQPPLSGDP
jgi:hypothetical protein